MSYESAEPRVGFKRHLRVETVPRDATYLLSVQGVTALDGRYVEALAPLLDGTRTLPALLREAASTVPPQEAGRIVGQLAKANLVGYHASPQPTGQDGDRAADAAELAYWDLVGFDGVRSAEAVRQSAVEIVTVGGVDAEHVADACRAAGLTVADDNTHGDAVLTLVVCEDYLDPELREINARHRAAGRPWLLAKPAGVEPWVGPVFQPDDGPCWSCLAHRLREHRRAEIPLQETLGLSGPAPRPDASLAAGRVMGLNLAVLEATKWLAGMRQDQQNAVCSLDTRSLRSEHHQVHRRPQCAECGDPELMAQRTQRPVVTVSRPKAALSGSNHRALTPEQVLARHRHLIDPVTGIITEVRPTPNTPAGLHRYVSGHNRALGGNTLAGVRSGLRSLSGGKGITAVEAEVGALCEAVERYCATRQGDEPTVPDTLAGLGRQAIHPNACQLFDERQFRDRERWNASHSPFQQVCAPFDPKVPTDWTPVWSFSAGTQRLLPTSMLYFESGPGRDHEGPWADSNGNAAGSSLEDAIVQGFLELVERDAVAVWWYNRTRQPGIDLDAFDEPWLTSLRESYARIRREIWALDLTSDLGIPVVAAVSRRIGRPTEDISFGFGAHFDPRLALRRAVTEMGQLLPSPPTRSPLSEDDDMARWWSSATVNNQPYLLPDPAEAGRTPSSFGDYVPHDDLRDDVDSIDALVRERGMELLVLDQTRPDVGLPVVKVLVPGLRHFWARLGPGRLFDVPVALGRRDRPTRYEDLNPIPLFV